MDKENLCFDIFNFTERVRNIISSKETTQNSLRAHFKSSHRCRLYISYAGLTLPENPYQHTHTCCSHWSMTEGGEEGAAFKFLWLTKKIKNCHANTIHDDSCKTRHALLSSVYCDRHLILTKLRSSQLFSEKVRCILSVCKEEV